MLSTAATTAFLASSFALTNHMSISTTTHDVAFLAPAASAVAMTKNFVPNPFRASSFSSPGHLLLKASPDDATSPVGERFPTNVVAASISTTHFSSAAVLSPLVGEMVDQGDDNYNNLFIPASKSLRRALELPLTAPAAAFVRSSRSDKYANDYRRPKIVGHRGSLYDALENTRPAFIRCVELGCDAVELDVFLTNEGRLVVFHGSGGDVTPGCLSHHVKDTSTNPGSAAAATVAVDNRSIIDLTYDEICQLQFNADNRRDFPCPREAIETATIPLLEQVLQDLKGTGVQVKIELKGPTIAVVKPVLDLVESMNMVGQCCYSSFRHDWLRQLRDLRPNRELYPTGALFNIDSTLRLPDDYLQQARDCGATEIHVPYELCTVRAVQEIHQAGFGSMVWFRGPAGMTMDVQDKYWDIGNEDEACYQALMDTGVQQLCLNRPSLAMEIVRRQ